MLEVGDAAFGRSLTMARNRRASRRLIGLELAGCVMVALACGFLFQVLLAFGAAVRAPAVATTFSSSLITYQHGGNELGSLLWHNAGPFVVFTLAGIFSARWSERSAQATAFRSVARGVVMLLPAAACWWVLSRQVATIAIAVGVSPFELLLRLPHGVLEFGALQLPLVASAVPRQATSQAQLRQVKLAALLGIVVLVAAAIVEVRVSPALLQIPVAGS